MYRDDKVRAEMASQKLTDLDLVEKTQELGNRLSRHTIAGIRQGETRDPQMSTLDLIARALGKDLPWIVEPKPETVNV